MAKTALKVDVVFNVTDETVEDCLRILEIWQKNNTDRHIECEECAAEDGFAYKFRIKQGNISERKERETWQTKQEDQTWKITSDRKNA